MTSPLDGVRLVALDLDGTLLPATKRLTDRARRVVADLRDAGIAVTLATGRGWNSAAAYAAELRLEQPLVTFEGALVALPPGAGGVAGRRPLHHRMLHVPLIRDVLRAIEGLHLGYFVCTEEERTVASRRLLSDRRAQIAIWDEVVHFVDAWVEAEARGYILHVVGPPEEIAEARRRLAAAGLEDVEYFHAEFWDGFDQIQVRPHGIGKDAGLRHVLGHLGLEPAQALAAGDWLNDLDMLRMVRVAVAPANADPRVRAVATHVLEGTCDDDAVVRFLEDALRAM